MQNNSKTTYNSFIDVLHYTLTTALCFLLYAVNNEARRTSYMLNKPTGVNPAGDAGDTSPQYFGWGDVNGNIPANIITYFWI